MFDFEGVPFLFQTVFQKFRLIFCGDIDHKRMKKKRSKIRWTKEVLDNTGNGLFSDVLPEKRAQNISRVHGTN